MLSLRLLRNHLSYFPLFEFNPYWFAAKEGEGRGQGTERRGKERMMIQKFLL